MIIMIIIIIIINIFIEHDHFSNKHCYQNEEFIKRKYGICKSLKSYVIV